MIQAVGGDIVLKFVIQNNISRVGDRKATYHNGMDSAAGYNQRRGYKAVQMLVGC